MYIFYQIMRGLSSIYLSVTYGCTVYLASFGVAITDAQPFLSDI